jgi:hypothetical protein
MNNTELKPEFEITGWRCGIAPVKGKEKNLDGESKEGII